MNIPLDLIDVTVRCGPEADIKWAAPYGLSVADIVADAPGLIVRDHECLVVLINGVLVPPVLWPRIRPKPCARVRVVMVTEGGDDVGTGFQLFNAALFASNPALGVFAAIGGKAITDIFSRRKKAKFPGAEAASEGPRDAGTSINPLQPGATVWSVVGKEKIAPQLVATPYVDLEGVNQVVHLLFEIASEVDWTGPITVNDVDINDQADLIEYETFQGLPSDGQNTLVTKTAKFVPLGLEASEYRFRSNGNQAYISSPGDTTQQVLDARPKWQSLGKSSNSPDEIWIALLWANGFYLGAAAIVSMALRIRIRLVGTVPWRNLPELRFRGQETDPVRYMIKLIYSATEPATANPAAGLRCFESHRFVGVTNPGVGAPGNVSYTADAYFTVDGTGSHVFVNDDATSILLDPAQWPAGVYEVQTLRGHSLAGEGAQINGAHMDIWSIDGGGYFVLESKSSHVTRLTYENLQSIRNVYPVTETGKATLAIRAKTQVSAVEAVVTGRCPIFTGGNWNTVAATSNVAAWARNKLTGPYNANPLPLSLLNDAEWQAFYEHCVAEGLGINMTLSEETVEEFLTICELAGEAKKKRGALWGYWIDEDRSGEAPVQLFTPISTRGMSWSRSFEDDVKAYRVEFRDSDDDYKNAEIIVYLDGYDADGLGGNIAVTRDQLHGFRLPGNWTVAEATRRALFALREINHRSIVTTLNVGIEHETLEIGDMVGLSHDAINLHASSSWVKSVTEVGGLVTGLVLEGELNLGNPDVADIWAVDDIWALPDIWDTSPVSVAIRLTDRTVTVKSIVETVDTNIVTFAAPFAPIATLKTGCLIAAGLSNTEYERLYVADIKGAADDGARLILMEEATEIHA
jgi:hypothetical protein